ncbi:hypothetical protein ADICYQ_3633 [Cyclobacterium qasimii M12-11B]|uniref:Uncharacterized protein n=1 Tax=Cyclobacterium qasimii M12-11B TaxID=641524 RepID=S7VAV8_9BACT|nr:hypothetical protein ADICYQ_3633 [Cyclobacterium qasimii M12-11B]
MYYSSKDTLNFLRNIPVKKPLHLTSYFPYLGNNCKLLALKALAE